jgi:phosphatidylglycerol:prolipoprotein diacylglycerol transferase
MHPILFHIGSFTLPTYGLMVACGYLAAMIYIFRKAGAAGFKKEPLSDMIFYSVLGGMAGGKLFYAATYWREFGDTFAGRFMYALRTFQYGFVFYGGLIFGAAAFFLTAARKKLAALRAADLFAPALALGHAFGRIGCFSAGCCYGSPTSCALSVTFTNPASEVNPAFLGVPLHPTQLYEAAGNFMIFLVLNAALTRSQKNGWRAGRVVALYAALYSVERFLVEFLRGDDRGAMRFGLSPAQLISAAAFLAAAAALYALKAQNEKK